MHSASNDELLQLPLLLDALVADNRLDAAQAQRIRQSEKAGTHPLITIAHDRLPLEALTQWLARQVKLPYLKIDPLSIDTAKVTALFPYAYAQRYRILPISVGLREITVATCEPYALSWLPEIGRTTQKEVKVVLSSPADIARYQVEFYAIARSVRLGAEARGGGGKLQNNLQNLEQLTELGRSGRLSADDQHIINIVDWLLQYAYESRASDIHLEPRRDTGNVRFRIDGVLHEVYQVPPTIMLAMTARLKILGRLDVSEKRKPQDGRIKTRSPDGREIELRVSSLPTAFGEKLVLRIFDPDVLIKDFSALGFGDAQKPLWEGLLKQPNGILLVTGPTGSGKTTTVYSSLKQLARPEVNVCTIEDPIELVEPSFNQMQVNHAIDLNFATGIRALLRQDPDIIMVGEIRDLETAEIAVQAALTGHLVLATLHTNDTPSAVTRLLELGVPAYLLKATLLGALAQRLVRRLCPHCKALKPIDPDDWRAFTANRLGQPVPSHIYQPQGCLECRNTGYLGRAGIYELLVVTDPLRELVSTHADLMRLREAALAAGLAPLRLAGAQLVLEGHTSMAEVIKATPSL
jgi:general secretion pathway protein E